MAKIRDDLVGAIHAAGGVVLVAGDTVPVGVVVHESRLAKEPQKAAEPVADSAPAEPKPAPKRRPRKKAADADSVD